MSEAKNEEVKNTDTINNNNIIQNVIPEPLFTNIIKNFGIDILPTHNSIVSTDVTVISSKKYCYVESFKNTKPDGTNLDTPKNKIILCFLLSVLNNVYLKKALEHINSVTTIITLNDVENALNGVSKVYQTKQAVQKLAIKLKNEAPNVDTAITNINEAVEKLAEITKINEAEITKINEAEITKINEAEITKINEAVKLLEISEKSREYITAVTDAYNVYNQAFMTKMMAIENSTFGGNSQNNIPVPNLLQITPKMKNKTKRRINRKRKSRKR
jgi:hypothetical protein